MPARKGSKKYNHHHSFLGANSANLKTISKNDEKLQEQKSIIEKQNKEIHALEMRIHRKQEKLKSLKAKDDQPGPCKKSKLSGKCIQNRLTNPSSNDIKLKTKSIRRKETFQAC